MSSGSDGPNFYLLDYVARTGTFQIGKKKKIINHKYIYFLNLNCTDRVGNVIQEKKCSPMSH